MGTLPLTCPCCSTKAVWAYLSHTKERLSFPILSPAWGCCCSLTSWSQNISYHAVFFSCVSCSLGVCVKVWMAGQLMCGCMSMKEMVCACSLARGWKCYLGAVFGMRLSSEAEIHPSIYVVQYISLPVLARGMLDRLHASYICMLHEHNLLTPSGTSPRPFALFLRSYAKWTNLWS